jgi:molybdate transport system ATP-binding protein
VKLILRDGVIERGGFRLRAAFEAPLSGVTVVFGPSGAGKSMLLSAIAGLGGLREGRLEVAGQPLEDRALGLSIPAHARDMGLVFQDARLFPHLSVRGNLDYAARRAPAERRHAGVDEVARRMDLADLLDRSVRTLSGGERSRVALARALVAAPRVLLLDEPFAALDGRRRRDYLALLRSVAREQDLPMLVVTHQVEDVAFLADHVVALRSGAVIAWGAAGEVMNGSVFSSLLDERDQGARIEAGRLSAGESPGAAAWARADTVIVAVERPRGLSARNVWAGEVVSVEVEGERSAVVRLQTEAGPVLARVRVEVIGELGLKPGVAAYAVLKAHAI